MSVHRRARKPASGEESVARGRDETLRPAGAEYENSDIGESGSDADIPSESDVEDDFREDRKAEPRLEPTPTTVDDTPMILAGLAGFFLAMGVAIAILRVDVDLDKSYVMATGLVSLLTFVMYASMCNKRKPTDGLDEDVCHPSSAFIGAAGFGLLLGGLFGDLMRRLPPGTILIPGVF